MYNFDEPMGVYHDGTKGDVIMHDAPRGDDHGACFGTNYNDTAFIMTMLQDMQMKQDERYDEECKWRDTFEAAQMKQFCLMHQHMSTQDSNFKDFAAYVTESLVSLRIYMNSNHDVIIAKIDHLISSQEEDYVYYERFYREMFDFLDSRYHGEGQGWHRGIQRGRGRR